MKNKKLKLIALAGVTVVTAIMLTGCGKNEVKTYDKDNVNVNVLESPNQNNEVNKNIDEAKIKELYLAKLEKNNNENPEKLADYRVDDVKILSENDKKSLLEAGDGLYYKDTDILAYVEYSIQPQDINNTTWIAGNGTIEKDWIVAKIACVCIRDGEIVSDGTGW